MGLTNIAGVFSRYFIVGFFLPAFFALVVLAQVVDAAFLPSVYEEASSSGQIAILGGAALLAGLFLLGTHHDVLRLYEGYPLQSARAPLRQIHALLLERQRRRIDEVKRRIAECPEGEDPFEIRWELDQRFPHSQPGLLLPTAFGNAVRAFEWHPHARWHLNGVGAWPHVENLLTAQEAQVLADARGDVAFFVNGSLVSALTGLTLAADRIAHDPKPAWQLDVLTCAAPFALATLLYLAAVRAAMRWGSSVRASIDLHRRELYTKLGVRQPLNFSDERQIAWRLNSTLLVGDHMPDDMAAPPAPADQRSPDGGGGSDAAPT